MSVYSTSHESLPSTQGALITNNAQGSYRVRYNPDSDWDFTVHALGKDSPVDVDLVLPHFRATNQPLHHRLNMYVSNQTGPIKAKVCRNVSRTKFYLEVKGGQSDVTLFLPSDFKGQIRAKGKAAYCSPGFTKFIMPRARMNKNIPDSLDDDHVVISTRGTVTFRMWDIHTGAPEHHTSHKIFGRFHRSPSPTSSDGEWDFLLDG